MILQGRLTRLYRISWKHQDRFGLKPVGPLVGHRRLRFSFFTNELFRRQIWKTDIGRQTTDDASSVLRRPFLIRLFSEPGL
jgi:hypothetical protein